MMMDFGQVVHGLKRGGTFARDGWNGKGMWIAAQFPDANSKMTLPYMYIEYPAGHPAYPNGSRVPWLASQTDMMAEDWIEIERQETDSWKSSVEHARKGGLIARAAWRECGSLLFLALIGEGGRFAVITRGAKLIFPDEQDMEDFRKAKDWVVYEGWR